MEKNTETEYEGTAYFLTKHFSQLEEGVYIPLEKELKNGREFIICIRKDNETFHIKVFLDKSSESHYDFEIEENEISNNIHAVRAFLNLDNKINIMTVSLDEKLEEKCLKIEIYSQN